MTFTRARAGRRVAAAAGISLILASALTACGAAKEASEADRGSSSTGSDGGVSNSTFEQEMTAWTEKFDACLRDEGIDIPTRSPNEMLDLSTLGVDETTFKEADSVCVKKVGQAPVDPNLPTEEEYYQQQLSFAKCMRDSGYDWDDPTPPSDGMAPGVAPLEPGAYDEKVLDACAVKAGFETGQSHG
ncbi:MAG: hypothetical protein ACTJGT_12205 [Microbacteriaceae bacterium]